MAIKEHSTKICFVVSAIGELNSTTRYRADEVLSYIVKPALEECGYTAMRADAIDGPGVITTDMINQLLEAPLVIADLTDRNPNVYYEVGVRHAFGKPIVLISEEDNIPFDLQTVRYISFNHTSLTSVHNCINQIVSQIKAIEAEPNKLTSPISQVATLKALEVSDQPIEKMMYELQSQIGVLTTQMNRVVLRSMVPEVSTNFHKLLTNRLFDYEVKTYKDINSSEFVEEINRIAQSQKDDDIQVVILKSNMFLHKNKSSINLEDLVLDDEDNHK